MTRGSEVSPLSWVFRGNRKLMILRLELKNGKIHRASSRRRSGGSARQLRFAEGIHEVVREQTPGSREPGED